jgi:hypothetical protein
MTVPPQLIALYGPDNPNRVWYILMTLCVLACISKGTRRAGGIGFISLLALMFISRWLVDTYRSFTPH